MAAERLRSGNQADWLPPQLHLTFGWLVPIFVIPAALIWGLAVAFDLIWVESLPETLRDAALHEIGAVRRLW
jgi:hypothetical protein